MIQDHVVATLEKIREPLALDRWVIMPSIEDIPDARAYCMAHPEYREAKIAFDMDKLETGDDVVEITVHESTHCHTWPLHALCERYANMLADVLPEPYREGFRKGLLEEVRLAGEQVTTDVGHTYLRLLRRAGVLDKPVETA